MRARTFWPFAFHFSDEDTIKIPTKQEACSKSRALFPLFSLTPSLPCDTIQSESTCTKNGARERRSQSGSNGKGK